MAVVSWLDGFDSQASVRSRTSRLYYAAYLEARGWCEDRLGYVRTRSGREHADVPRLLRELNPDLAKDLAFLRTFRNAADYDMHLSHETLALQLSDARLLANRIIARLDALAARPPDT